MIADFNWRLANETEGLSLDRERLLGGVTALIKDPAKGFYLVAEVDGQVAGQLCITYEWSDWRNATFWWFQSVYVSAAFRGQGVFKRLFRHIHDLAKARQDVCGLRLYVEHENQRAREVYQKLGLRLAAYKMMEIDFVLSH